MCSAALFFACANLPAAEPLDLPQLISTERDLAAAVIRRADGSLTAARLNDVIAPGRWRLDAVAQHWIVLVPAENGDSEVGTRARLYLAAANKAPLLIRSLAPPAPLAPSLHLQTGTLKPASKPKQQP